MTRYYHSFFSPHRSDSVTHHLIKTYRLVLLALVIVIVSSCEEDATKIGSGILPGSDFVDIYSTDTLSVWSYTMYDESVRTEHPSISHLGYVYDPYFGSTKAEFVTEIRMGSEWDDKPFVIDSVKLHMTILDVRGVESDLVHSLKLTEIAERIYLDSVYYSDRPVDTTDYSITVELPILKPDTINQIVLDLPVEFGEYLTRDTSKLFYSNTRPDFRSFFNGLYFRLLPSPEPLLVTLSLRTSTALVEYQNILVLYMHDENDEEKEFWFILDAVNRNASYNLFSHDFSTASPDKKIEHINDGYPDTLSYQQYLKGVYTRLTFPGLEVLKNNPSFDDIGINKARLTIPYFSDGDLYTSSTAPTQLFLKYNTRSGSEFIVPDYNIDQYNDFFDGRIDPIENVYNFNLATFVQAYLDDTSDEILPELEVFFEISGTNGVILNANSSKNPVKFELIYTKY